MSGTFYQKAFQIAAKGYRFAKAQSINLVKKPDTFDDIKFSKSILTGVMYGMFAGALMNNVWGGFNDVKDLYLSFYNFEMLGGEIPVPVPEIINASKALGAIMYGAFQNGFFSFVGFAIAGGALSGGLNYLNQKLFKPQKKLSEMSLSQAFRKVTTDTVKKTPMVIFGVLTSFFPRVLAGVGMAMLATWIIQNDPGQSLNLFNGATLPFNTLIGATGLYGDLLQNSVQGAFIAGFAFYKNLRSLASLPAKFVPEAVYSATRLVTNFENTKQYLPGIWGQHIWRGMRRATAGISFVGISGYFMSVGVANGLHGVGRIESKDSLIVNAEAGSGWLDFVIAKSVTLSNHAAAFLQTAFHPILDDYAGPKVIGETYTAGEYWTVIGSGSVGLGLGLAAATIFNRAILKSREIENIKPKRLPLFGKPLEPIAP